MLDPYHRWLGIPRGQRPPTYYQLLGIAPDETDPEVIQEAALRQTSHVRLYQTGPHAAQCTALLNEIGQARAVLLNPEKRRQYDAGLDRDSKPAPPPPPPPTPAPPAIHEPTPVDEPGPAMRAWTGRRLDYPLGPAVGFAVVLVLGAGLAFTAGLARPGPQPEPAPTPPSRPQDRGPTPSPRPETRRTLAGHEAAVRALLVAPDGSTVLSAGGSHLAGAEGEALGCAARCWDLRSGRALRLFVGHQAPIHCLALSRDGKQMLTGAGGCVWRDGAPLAGDCTVRLWDVGSGKEVLAFSEHDAPVRGVAFLPDGHGVVSCSSDGIVLLWDVRRRPLPRPLWREPGRATCLALSPGGRSLLVGGSGQPRLWEFPGPREIDRFPPGNALLHALAFAPDGKQAAGACGRLGYHDGKLAGTDCLVRVWDLQQGAVLRELTGHTRPVLTVAWGRDGNWIASGSLDGTVRLWSARNGSHLRTLQAGSGVTCVALAGKRLLAGTLAGTIQVWDLGQERTK